MDKSKNYKTLGALNLIKFLLFSLVFLFHWNIHYDFTDFKSITLEHLVHSGGFTMTCFFVLSGFLLYHVYHDFDFSRPENLRKFYEKRLVKILPSYFLILIINCILEYLYRGFNKPTNYLIHFTAAQSFFPKEFLSEFCTPGLWFITVIMFLYFLFPLLSILVKSFKNLFLPFITVYIIAIIPDIVGAQNDLLNEFYNNPVFRICQFMCGIIFGELYVRHGEEKRIYALYGVIFLIFTALSIRYMYPNTFQLGLYDIPVLIFFPPAVYYFAKSKGKIFLMLTQNGPVNFLGNIAYAFFLAQTIVQSVMWYWIKPANYYGYSPNTVLIVCFAANLLLALPIFGVEKLFVKLSKKINH